MRPGPLRRGGRADIRRKVVRFRRARAIVGGRPAAGPRFFPHCREMTHGPTSPAPAARAARCVRGAAPAHAQTDEQFRKVYDELGTMKAGSLPRLLAVLTPARAKVVKKECADPAEKAAGFAMGASMQPTSYKIVGRTPCKGGKKVIIYLIGTFEVPPDVAKARDIPEKSRNEISVDFLRVGKAWKMDTPSYGGDPDKVKQQKDLKRGDLSKYKDDAETSLGDAYCAWRPQDETVAVILRVLDEENVVFLPPAAEALVGASSTWPTTHPARSSS